jgi:hypothetical protein
VSAPRPHVVSGAQRRPFTAFERVMLVAEILVTYLRVRRVVKRRDLREVVAVLRSGAPEARADSAVVRRVAYRLASAVHRTLGELPIDSRCLMRSLVLSGMLARRGVGATVVVGVRVAPDFGAHAWVEYQGCALLPPLDVDRLVEI